MKARRISLFAAFMGILLLIFDSKTATDGIREGISLCLQTLIPSLFPFFILSGIITSGLIGRTSPCMERLCRFCHMPKGCESFLAVGVLGGFPVGAGTLHTALEEGQITSEEANRLAVFCNNAGPSFIFGVLGPLFPDKSWVFILWIIQVTSAILTGHFHSGRQRAATLSEGQPIGFVTAVRRGAENMAAVCSWVVLFRMLIAFLNRWILWLVPDTVRILLTGMLELANGCVGLTQVTSISQRFVMASLLLSAGGFCVMMQTKAVFPELNWQQYLAGKAVYTLISLILSVSAATVLRNPPLLTVLLPVILIAIISIDLHLRRKSKKAVAIP